ncbi:MAG: type I restriction enzyme HsdR N-terminal domain-containing protein [Alphaproteobacteria bacterium]|nr:type I restriction enzyme HsdR N-terminal domain-containing protein [Alphaproteobacteria bacterium]MBP7759105.1 type I restriction enzyme HsdR N-terminal domain-containing protein [Alphaproteobacteria bacterium]MBP7762469.1 type I restriction enzyme HsdR N-terminal domain-containing protein [Alphaproteobacteria bacterium]MBP7905562.1 type I restriction enzyme HsdR N-terminal domain-containing protein [Alphaproteobacteria bacterium]
MSVPSKAVERIKSSLKRFQPILQSAKAKDSNESDTVTIVTDMLEYVFGYDKYADITSEYSIRGTYCDLAVKIDGNIVILIEVKAIGLELKEPHVKQAIDYAANKGIEWVGLTNGVSWRIYKVGFGKPITSEIVVEFDMLQLSHKNSEDIEKLALLAKEGHKKAKLQEYHSYRQVLNRFTVAALLLSDSVISTIRKELRRTASDVKVTNEEIKAVLENEIIKREVIEGDKATQAKRLVSRSEKNLLRKSMKTSLQDNSEQSQGEEKIATS